MAGWLEKEDISHSMAWHGIAWHLHFYTFMGYTSE
jgi:hypothetical protein